MTDWVWVEVAVAVAAHEEQLAEHGGAAGVRDFSMLESAMARPFNLIAYRRDPDIADLAASYAFGIARNHPFADGNKRTAVVVSETFLVLNGHMHSECSDVEMVTTFLALASGELTVENLAAWFRRNIVSDVYGKCPPSTLDGHPFLPRNSVRSRSVQSLYIFGTGGVFH